MRASEFITETTTSGAIATVAMPIGQPITRSSGSMFTGKYTNDPFPNTPKRIKQNKGKKNAK